MRSECQRHTPVSPSKTVPTQVTPINFKHRNSGVCKERTDTASSLKSHTNKDKDSIGKVSLLAQECCKYIRPWINLHTCDIKQLRQGMHKQLSSRRLLLAASLDVLLFWIRIVMVQCLNCFCWWCRKNRQAIAALPPRWALQPHIVWHFISSDDRSVK